MPDHSDIEALFLENYKRMFYLAQKILGDQSAAEDVVHDVFLNLWRQKQVFESPGKARSYIYTAIRNGCLNRLRHGKIVQAYNADQYRQIPQHDEDRGLDLIIRAEVLGQVLQAIEELPEGCRTVLKLAYFESMKNDEIADRMGISINTVKTQKARALQLLRMRLDASSLLLFLSCILK